MDWRGMLSAFDIYGTLLQQYTCIIHSTERWVKRHEGKGIAQLKMQFCLICACGINDPPFLRLQISSVKAEAYAVTEADLWYGL